MQNETFHITLAYFYSETTVKKIDCCLLQVINCRFVHPGLADVEEGNKIANSLSANIVLKGSRFGLQSLIKWSRENFAGLMCGRSPWPLRVTLHVPHGFLPDFTSVAPLLPPAHSQRERRAGHWGHGLDAFFCSAGQRDMLTSCSRKATLCLSY